MKKLTLSLVCILLSAATGGAALLPQGTSELALSGVLDFDSPGGSQFDATVYYGYFIQDYFQVGLKVSFFSDDDFTKAALGPRIEHNFDLGTEFSPFVAASVVLSTVDGPEGYGNKNALIFGFEGGAKYFITEYFAISGALVFDLATDKIYLGDNDRQAHDVRVEFGVRTYF